MAGSQCRSSRTLTTPYDTGHKTLDDLPGDVRGIRLVNIFSDGDRPFRTETMRCYELHHQLQPPHGLNTGGHARFPEGPVIGGALPAFLLRDEEADVILERELTSSSCSFHDLIQIRFDNLEAEPRTFSWVKPLDLLCHGDACDVQDTDMAASQLEN